MQANSSKQMRTVKTISWLQVLIGLIILSTATYRYVSHDYDLKVVNMVSVAIFGLMLPAIAIYRITQLNKQQKQIRREETWQEPEIL